MAETLSLIVNVAQAIQLILEWFFGINFARWVRKYSRIAARYGLHLLRSLIKTYVYIFRSLNHAGARLRRTCRLRGRRIVAGLAETAVFIGVIWMLIRLLFDD